MVINKIDLVSTNYSWDEDDLVEREDLSPSRRTFDRTNGAHILWLMNWYSQQHLSANNKKISELEVLIATQLPKELRSEISVCHWVLNTVTT
jgi:hypothetical protein